MTYYKILLSCDPKVIGVNNGIYQVALLEKYINKSTFNKMIIDLMSINPIDADEMARTEYSFIFKKLKKTKNTTFMSFSPYMHYCKFLLSKEGLELLGKFNICKYWNYTSAVYEHDESQIDESFSMFCCSCIDYSYTDFNTTIFSARETGARSSEKTYHKFNNIEEYRSCPKSLTVEKIGISKKFDENLDLFSLQLGGIYVSERLRHAMEKRGVTGLDFKTANLDFSH